MDARKWQKDNKVGASMFVYLQGCLGYLQLFKTLTT